MVIARRLYSAHDQHRAAFVGNLFCLDFVNTRPMRNGVRVDLLGSFGELARWLAEGQMLSEEHAGKALHAWDGTRAGDRASPRRRG